MPPKSDAQRRLRKLLPEVTTWQSLAEGTAYALDIRQYVFSSTNKDTKSAEGLLLAGQLIHALKQALKLTVERVQDACSPEAVAAAELRHGIPHMQQRGAAALTTVDFMCEARSLLLVNTSTAPPRITEQLQRMLKQPDLLELITSACTTLTTILQGVPALPADVRAYAQFCAAKAAGAVLTLWQGLATPMGYKDTLSDKQEIINPGLALALALLQLHHPACTTDQQLDGTVSDSSSNRGSGGICSSYCHAAASTLCRCSSSRLPAAQSNGNTSNTYVRCQSEPAGGYGSLSTTEQPGPVQLSAADFGRAKCAAVAAGLQLAKLLLMWLPAGTPAAKDLLTKVAKQEQVQQLLLAALAACAACLWDRQQGTSQMQVPTNPAARSKRAVDQQHLVSMSVEPGWAAHTDLMKWQGIVLPPAEVLPCRVRFAAPDVASTVIKAVAGLARIRMTDPGLSYTIAAVVAEVLLLAGPQPSHLGNQHIPVLCTYADLLRSLLPTAPQPPLPGQLQAALSAVVKPGATAAAKDGSSSTELVKSSASSAQLGSICSSDSCADSDEAGRNCQKHLQVVLHAIAPAMLHAAKQLQHRQHQSESMKAQSDSAAAQINKLKTSISRLVLAAVAANFGGPPSALLQLSGMVQQQPLASLTSLELAMRQSHPCSTTRDSMSRLIESQPELARLWLLACRMSTGQSPGVLSPRLLCSVAAADLPGALGGLVSVLASGLRIASHFYEDCREDPDRAPLPCMELFLHMVQGAAVVVDTLYSIAAATTAARSDQASRAASRRSSNAVPDGAGPHGPSCGNTPSATTTTTTTSSSSSKKSPSSSSYDDSYMARLHCNLLALSGHCLMVAGDSQATLFSVYVNSLFEPAGQSYLRQLHHGMAGWLLPLQRVVHGSIVALKQQGQLLDTLASGLLQQLQDSFAAYAGFVKFLGEPPSDAGPPVLSRGKAVPAPGWWRPPAWLVAALLRLPAAALSSMGAALVTNFPSAYVCSNPRCTCLDEESSSAAAVNVCTGCQVARYCSPACSHAHWQAHKPVCRRLAAAAAKPALFDNDNGQQVAA